MVMAKIERSAVELALIIRTQINKPKLHLAVFADARGWHATVYAEPSDDRDLLQRRVDEAARELNRIYQLGP